VLVLSLYIIMLEKMCLRATWGAAACRGVQPGVWLFMLPFISWQCGSGGEPGGFLSGVRWSPTWQQVESDICVIALNVSVFKDVFK